MKWKRCSVHLLFKAASDDHRSLTRARERAFMSNQLPKTVDRTHYEGQRLGCSYGHVNQVFNAEIIKIIEHVHFHNHRIVTYRITTYIRSRPRVTRFLLHCPQLGSSTAVVPCHRDTCAYGAWWCRYIRWFGRALAQTGSDRRSENRNDANYARVFENEKKKIYNNDKKKTTVKRARRTRVVSQ